jgi:hypothetical protein
MPLSLSTDLKDAKNLLKIYIISLFLSVFAWPEKASIKEILGLATITFLVILVFLYIWNLLAPTEDLR